MGQGLHWAGEEGAAGAGGEWCQLRGAGQADWSSMGSTTRIHTRCKFVTRVKLLQQSFL